MKEKSYTVVTTTIRIPKSLENYAKDAFKYKRKLNEFIIIGDKKTPSGVTDFCKKIEKKYLIRCSYFSPKKQEEFLKKFPLFKNYLPWNNVARRNIGFILAYLGNSDIVVTVDDDNFICHEDYFNYHSHIGDILNVESVSTLSGWWNVCKMLKEERNIPFYHRGYPLSKRWQKDKEKIKKIEGRIMVNAGLWLGNPDIDAFTRIALPISVVSVSNFFKDKIACTPGTLSPFNTQNTAVAREVLPAYFLCPYILGRNHDIWASYIIRRITDHLRHLVTYGMPLVRQDRNPHNLFRDFEEEKFTLEYNDFFIEALFSCQLKGFNYLTCFQEITEQLPKKMKEVYKKNKINFQLFDKLFYGLKLWADIFTKI